MISLRLLDGFFLLFHTSLVVFNLTGWAFPRARRLHLLTLGATAASWLLMGLWHGIGYCICTDWHWRVRQALGYHDRSTTYVQFLVERTLGIVPDLGLTKAVSGVAFGVAVLLSLYVNYGPPARPAPQHS